MAELALLFLALNLADVLLTCWLLGCGGVEANPLLCGRGDWPAMKMAMAAGCALFVVSWGRVAVMRGLVFGMLLVVMWNVAMAGVALW
jgi:hypothetical protein